jgi:hypothetical protein
VSLSSSDAGSISQELSTVVLPWLFSLQAVGKRKALPMGAVFVLLDLGLHHTFAQGHLSYYFVSILVPIIFYICIFFKEFQRIYVANIFTVCLQLPSRLQFCKSGCGDP